MIKTKRYGLLVLWRVILLFLFTSGLAGFLFAGEVIQEHYNGRNFIVYKPTHINQDKKALVVVLHGGLGSAERIESRRAENGLNMDKAAEKNGFMVAYLNGTPVAKWLRYNNLGWNAGGGCCGQPAIKNIDDVGYIQNAVNYLVGKYGINQEHIYGMGHSNGAMMTQRLMCEVNLYAASVVISGPLNISVASCSAAQGKRILAIHGADDKNVPVNGGQGSRGLARISYQSEAYSERIFSQSGAEYHLQIVKGADHYLNHIDDMLYKNEGISIAEEAVRWFGFEN